MSESKATMRVLLVDDQILFVESLRCVLEDRAPELEVVGIAHDGNEAFFMTSSLKPDLILMDVRMPGMDGVQAAIKIHEIYPAIKIMMLTTFSDDEYVKIALKGGAIGYLLKNIPPDDLIRSIRAVKTSAKQIAPEILNRLLNGDDEGMATERPGRMSTDALTQREREVLELMIGAMSNPDIAGNLGVSEQTVKNHIHNIYSKLGISSRLQLIKLMNNSAT
jgi:DNA-binding NarL/FixJ family response regulator